MAENCTNPTRKETLCCAPDRLQRREGDVLVEDNEMDFFPLSGGANGRVVIQRTGRVLRLGPNSLTYQGPGRHFHISTQAPAPKPR